MSCRLPPGSPIAVIGAGAAGLAAARALSAAGFAVSVFEAAADLGGTWLYNPAPAPAPAAAAAAAASEVPETLAACGNSMYRDLHTNLPAPVMAFPDLDFPAGEKSFPHHSGVLAYLRAYAARWDLLRMVKFSTVVLKVTETAKSPANYSVTTAPASNPAYSSTSSFRAIVAANGHYSVPEIPDLRGAATFPGELLHSHDYRAPEPFRGKSVVIVGAGNSAVDIAIELRGAGAKVVAVASRGGVVQALEGLFVQRRVVVGLGEDGAVVFEGGEREENVDVVMLCTGYRFAFPFLDPALGVEVAEDGSEVYGLAYHLIPVRRPTLALMGLPYRVAPFPLFHFQAAYLAALYSGKVEPPTEEEVASKHPPFMRSKGHLLAESQWEYNRVLADLAGVPPLKPVVKSIYMDCSKARREDVLHYKSRQYVRLGDSESDWAVKVHGEDVSI